MPELYAAHRVAPVENYPNELLAVLQSSAPRNAPRDPTAVLLTPGQYNSAYYEHSFLADKMGIELVEGNDLFVRDGIVFMRTTEGPKRVDIIYRRVDDAFIDPLVFDPNSMLGVPGLFAAYAAGNVTLANAVGTGAVDDKVVYSYVPDMVRFYLGEDPILKNVPTWRCRQKDDLAYVLDHLSELVISRNSARALSRTRPITWPSRRSRSRPVRPSSIRASPRATSICGPSSSPALMVSASCRAA